MYGRSYKNTFPHFPWHLKNSMTDQSSRIFIKETIFSPSRCNVKFLLTDHVVDFVRMNSGMTGTMI